MQHLRFAVRTLAKHPGFAIPALLALALGIGAATTIFSVVDCVLLRPLPYPQSDRLISLVASFPDGAEILPSTEFLNWSRSNRSLETAAAQGAGGPVSWIGPDGATSVLSQKVTVGFLNTLRVRPAVGRDFVAADGTVGAPAVVILSHSLWQSRFGGDRSVIGRSINLDGALYQVIGILPASFRFTPNLEPLDVLLPIQIAPSFYTDRNEMRAWRPIARLKPGVTIAQARTEFGALLSAAIRDTAREMPRLYSGARLQLEPYRDHITRGVRSSLLLLLGGVGCVLLIACANVANLLLARGAGRRREMAVRAALGASRARLVRHLLTESLVLAAAGGVLGLALCCAAAPAIRNLMAHKLPRIAELTIDARMLGGALLIGLLTGVLFGLMPALGASRAGISESLKRQSGRSGMWLAAAELGLALTLLVTAGLLFQSLWRAQSRGLGFDAGRLLVANVSLKKTRFAQAPPERIEERLAEIPGAISWTVADGLPPNGGCCGITLALPGQPAQPSRDRGDLTVVRNASLGYFKTMGVALQRGRLPNAHDSNVLLINEALARRYFPGEDPIGKPLLRRGAIIIGVIADAKNEGLRSPVNPEILIPLAKTPDTPQIAVRFAGDPELLARALERQLRAMDPMITARVRTIQEEFRDESAQPRFLSGLFGVFALIAVTLGMVGIYGVMSFTVASRTREIGIRMALGADGRRVRSMIVRDACRPILAGIALGLAGSAAAARLAGNLLYDIRPTDPVTYIAFVGLLVLAALGAALAPARRASRVDPAVVLKAD